MQLSDIYCTILCDGSKFVSGCSVLFLILDFADFPERVCGRVITFS